MQRGSGFGAPMGVLLVPLEESLWPSGFPGDICGFLLTVVWGVSSLSQLGARQGLSRGSGLSTQEFAASI